MRSVFVAFLVSTTAFLAGCSDDGHGDHAYTCPDGTELDLEDFPDHDNETFNPLSKCPKRGSSTNSTSLAPNQLPRLTLKTTDDGGNVTNVTLLMGNLTFSAEGSVDPDGTINGIAVQVTDSNTTRTASLYDPASKSFKPATFKFDRPGVVNVTVAMVDDRAGFTVNTTKVYVNHPQTLASQSIALPGGNDAGAECGDALDEPITGAMYFKPFSFALGAGATFVEATGVVDSDLGGTAVLTICDPAKQPVSPTAEDSTVSDQPLAAPTGIESYFVGVTLGSQSQPNSSISVSVIVHYEPQSAAAPAE